MTHHDEPWPDQRSLENLIKVCWRHTDTLGYAAFSPTKEWVYEATHRIPPERPSFLVVPIGGVGQSPSWTAVLAAAPL